MSMDIHKIREDFPILKTSIHDRPLIYLDSAASAQRPVQVITHMEKFMKEEYANVHRGLHTLSNRATDAFEGARERVARFLNAESEKQIIFTSGATEGINLVSYSFIEPQIKKGDEIVLSVMEHHSNIVPWHFLRERKGAILKWVKCDAEGNLDINALKKALSPKTKILAITQMSNVLGTITKLNEIIKIAHKKNVPVLVDGCQGAVHLGADMQALDCDFYVFSGHKIYGPTGIGVLYGKREHLESMRPFQGGGEMIKEVTQEKISYGGLPYRFEAGTPPIIEAVGLHAALDYITEIGVEDIRKHEQKLLALAESGLSDIQGVTMLGTESPKGSILSFLLDGVHPHDVATLLDREGIAVRAGHHCAQPLMEHLGVSATVRASLALYTSSEEIERFIEATRRTQGFFKKLGESKI